jgi:hypothetical protein
LWSAALVFAARRFREEVGKTLRDDRRLVQAHHTVRLTKWSALQGRVEPPIRFGHIPTAHAPWGFAAALLLMMLSSVVPYLWFRQKGWS